MGWFSIKAEGRREIRKDSHVSGSSIRPHLGESDSKCCTKQEVFIDSLIHLFIQTESTSDAFVCDLTPYLLLHILRVQILWPVGTNGHKSCITKSCFMAIYYFLKLLNNIFLYLDLGIGYSLFLNRNL